MVKKERYIGLGIDRDTAPDKRKTDTYWDAENISIINNGRALSIKPILGETQFLTIPERSGGYQLFITGHTVYNENIFVFTVDEGNQCAIHKIDSLANITTLAYGNWGWIKDSTRVDTLINYENVDIIKLYFIDNINPLRFINISDTALSSDVNTIIEVIDTTAPLTEGFYGGGSLIAGSIQYVYNCYNFYGSQSTLSPASPLIHLAIGYKGAWQNESTGKTIKITIDNSSILNFDALKIYSIHYTELNQTPTIKLIYDERISSNPVEIYDDGNLLVANYSVQDLLNLITYPYIPDTFAIKRERLFIANYKLNNFNPDIDTRAYSFSSSAVTFYTTHESVTTEYTDYTDVPETNDAINPDYSVYKYKYNSTTLGGSGLNIEYTFTTQTVNNTYASKSFKRNEIYRMGIIFYNQYGQYSPVKWIADFKTPTTLGNDNYIGLSVNLTSAGVSALQSEGVTKYQICIVERRPEDRTIISQGFFVPACLYTLNGAGSNESPYYYPYYIVKDILTIAAAGFGADISEDYELDVDWGKNAPGTTYPHPQLVKDIGFFYSTDTIFETDLILPDKIRILGEAIRWVASTVGNYTELYQYRDDARVMFASFNHSEPDWGDPTWSGNNWANPYHVMGQSTGLVPTHTEVVQYIVAQNKVYDTLSLTDYTDSDKIISLNTSETPAKFLASGESVSMGPNKSISNSISLPKLVRDDTAHLETTYYAGFASTIVLNFQNTTWHQDGGVDWKAFDAADLMSNAAQTKRGIPLMELLRTVNNQYGGNSYESKQRNEYLPLGQVRNIDITVNDEFIGDIFVGTLSVNRSDGLDNKLQGQMGIYEHIHIPYIENNHNVYARNDNMHSWLVGWFYNQDMRYLRLSDNHRLFGAFNQIPNVFKNYPTPYTFKDVDDYPITVLGSNPKTSGELTDSWFVFNPSNFKQMEGQYGTISKLHNLNGELLCIQSTGIALLEIEPRIQTQDSDGIAIQLGIGNLFYNHKYISTNSGSNRKWTICEDGKNLYYYNDVLNTICNLQDGKLSTIKTVKGLLDEYPSGPHTSTFHNRLDQVYFQFNEFTLVYDLLLQKFISRNDLLNNNKWLVSNEKILYQFDDSGTTTYLYTQFTGEVKSSNITYLLCPDPIFEKVFHTLEYRLQGEDFAALEVYNDISSSGYALGDVKNKFDIHRIHLPRVQNSRERWRGIYIFVKLYNTKSFSLDDLVVMYNLKG